LVARVSQREFVGDPTSPAAARSFAKAALSDLLDRSVPPVLCDDLELIVSELVTNAVRAGSPTVHVSLGVEDDRIAIRVTDEAQGWPEQRTATIHDVGGRGLPLVSALSETWGVRVVETGKVVWAEIKIPA
jgi:anti-sigma regulatory factor (Ser/Thr protein kinase)